jgi:hypothetical protein
MRFSEILSILKGDVPGHRFHGNQWLKEDGGFDPNGQGGRRQPRVARPAPAPRQPAPKPPRAPRVARKPVVPTPAPKPTEITPDKKSSYIGPSSKTVVKKLEDFSDEGGAQQRANYKAEMSDGSVAMVKQLGLWHGFSGERLAQAEVLAGKVGAATGIPIRGAVLLKGSKDTVVQPFLEGKNAETIGGAPEDPINDPRDVPKAFQEAAGEIKLFDALTGNTDRHWGNVFIAGVPKDHVGWEQAADVPGARLVGIDHSLCYNGLRSPSVSRLQQAATQYKIPDSRITEIGAGLKKLYNSGTLSRWEKSQVKDSLLAYFDAFPTQMADL